MAKADQPSVDERFGGDGRDYDIESCPSVMRDELKVLT